jgi:predicted ATPase
LQIYVVEDGNAPPPTFPAITLMHDAWDDFGFKTTFYAAFWRTKDDWDTLHQLKIAEIGLEEGVPRLPDPIGNQLPENFGSLGADLGYYTKLGLLGPELEQQILTAMRDLATDGDRRKAFEEEESFKTSLLRLAPARDAFRRTSAQRSSSRAASESEPEVAQPVIVEGGIEPITIGSDPIGDLRSVSSATEVDGALRMEFTPPNRPDREMSPPTVVFDFAGPPELPSRMIVLVGPNGTGKTTLLSELALAIFFGATEVGDRGTVRTTSGSASQVLFISYSAYDNFEIPVGQETSGDARIDLAERGYVYVGLRELGAGNLTYQLKSPERIDQEFAAALQAIEFSDDRLEVGVDVMTRASIYLDAMDILLADPSFGTIMRTTPRMKRANRFQRLKRIFPSLSTGHKAAVNVVAALSAQLRRNGLVLLDEPEAHLHPPLVSTLLRVVRGLLNTFEANAIAATHSPVVVQETLGDHVIRFRRVDNRTVWHPLESQSFGENLAALSRDAFGLPAEQADFVGVLEGLVLEGHSLDEIERLFGERRLSSPARAQVLRFIGQRSARNR